MSDGGVRVIHARQRDRQGRLLGFDQSLSPHDFDWFVDKVQIELTASWSSNEDGAEFFARRLAAAGQADEWFLSPQFSVWTANLETSSTKRSTLGSLHFEAKGLARQRGSILIKLTANPTLVFSNLLAQHPVADQFIRRVEALSTYDFFRQVTDAVPPATDGGLNWIANPQEARRHLGSDLGAAFLPVWISKLQNAVAEILAEAPGDLIVEGTEHHIRTTVGHIILPWQKVRMPQIEVYFERYHRAAIEAVQTGGFALLSNDHRVQLTRHTDQLSLERNADRFSIKSKLSKTRSLSVYAKRPDRIRFEVARHGRGKYAPTNPRRPEARLLDIINQEQRRAASICRWPDIASHFVSSSTASLPDLRQFLAAVIQASDGGVVISNILTERLLFDAGFSAELVPEIPRRSVQQLVRSGVLKRVRIRARDENGRPSRYALSPRFAEMRKHLIRALDGKEETPD